MTEDTPKTPQKFDFKDIETLQRYLNSQGKLYSAKRTGLSARQQRQLKRAAANDERDCRRLGRRGAAEWKRWCVRVSQQ